MLTDVLEIHFINMIKFKRLETAGIANNPLERWLTFLNKDTPEEVLEEVIKMDTAISKANERLNFVSQDKEFLRTYQMREMVLSDWTTGINTAMEKGRAEGKAEERKLWQGVVADKDKLWQGVVADKDAEIAQLREQLAGKKTKV